MYACVCVGACVGVRVGVRVHGCMGALASVISSEGERGKIMKNIFC